jgi:hypothetical protein
LRPSARGANFSFAVYGRRPAAELVREICDEALPVTPAGSFAAEPAIEQRLEADREDDGCLYMRTDGRNGSRSPIGHDMISNRSSSDMPNRRSSF